MRISTLRPVHLGIITGFVTALLSTSCIEEGHECTFHCWQSWLPVEDMPRNVATPGYFSMLCTDSMDGVLPVRLPELGYGTRACLTGSSGPTDYPGPEFNSKAHFRLKSAITKLQNGDFLWTRETEAYNLWVAELRAGVITTCVNDLTCNQTPGACDIDGNPVNGSQSCNVSSATALCESLVADTLEAQLSLPSPEKYPVCSGMEVLPVSQFYTCEAFVPEGNGTDGGCIADGVVPDGDDGDEGDGNDGADSTGAPEGEDDPFGNISQLVACAGNDCTVDAQLLLNITQHFHVFADEGVNLQMVDETVTCGPGARVRGLNSNSAPAELASQFMVGNGDVITAVNGLPVESGDSLVRVLNEVAAETEFTVVVQRRVGQACSATTWNLSLWK